jgi:[ribosomal protein S5]-alanine N-acetyltransferase
MNLQSNRLYLNDFKKSEFDLFYSVFSNEQVMRYALMDRYTSKSEATTYFDSILTNALSENNRPSYQFALFSIDGDNFIGLGELEIHIKNSFGGCGEVGYFLLPPFWGNGYATEIATSLIKFGFQHLKLHRITARCNALNTQSEKVMKKVEMTKEGVFRKARFKNGRWDDEIHYSILIDEFKLDTYNKAVN